MNNGFHYLLKRKISPWPTTKYSTLHTNSNGEYDDMWPCRVVCVCSSIGLHVCNHTSLYKVISLWKSNAYAQDLIFLCG